MVFTYVQKRLCLAISIFTIAVVFLVGGCSSLSKKDSKATAPASRTGTAVAAQYYDFGDVLVPKELKVDKKSSFVYNTSGFSAGVLVLKGKIEISSLISFFETNMTNDNWNIISSFKSERTMLLFHKAHRWCVMSITDGQFSTYVEIWVAPTTKDTQTGLLK
jgi:uncharacterized protein YceK